MVKIEKDFSSLIKPSLLPQAYDDLLKEVSRRRKIFKQLSQIVEDVSSIVNNENQERKSFLTKYGNVLPESFVEIIPHLKENLKCKFVLDLEEMEKLPKIELTEPKK